MLGHEAEDVLDGRSSDYMTPPDEVQRLIEEHIASLDEKKGQLERALGHLRGPGAGEGNANPGRAPPKR
jgi:hypothetical protein